AEHRPYDAVLSEESVDNPIRLDAERVWIVDPLDGTREFGEPPREDWAVHVALVIGGDPVAGAVALPARAMVPSPAAAPDAERVPMGSAGAKAMAVVLGDVDVYAHSGGQYEWDSAAPVAVARA